MFKRGLLIASFVLLCTLLSGCWDQLEFKNIRLPTVISFDEAKSDNLQGTAIIRIPVGTSIGQSSMKNEKLIENGKTPSDCMDGWAEKTSGGIDFSQIHVVLLGEELAKKQFNQIVYDISTFQKTSYTVEMAIVDGKASKALVDRKDKTSLTDEYLGELLKGGVESDKIPDTTLKIVHTAIYDQGIDNVVPYIKRDKQKGYLRLDGVALMSEEGYSGKTLSPEQTSLLLMFQGAENINDNWDLAEEGLDDLVIRLRDTDVDKQFGQITDDELSVKIELDAEIVLRKNTRMGVKDKAELKSLNKKIADYYTKEAKKMFETLSKADCDALGLGRDLIAYHPGLWNAIQGEDYYQKIKVTPEVHINIIEANMQNR